MLRLAVALSLVAICCAQTRPDLSNTFTSAGEYEYHDTRGTFFGMFILDRDESKNMGVENATYKVGDLTEHYELLQLYNTGEQYTVRDDGKGDVHCQTEKLTGDLPKFWAWLAGAKYVGNETIRHVVYDEWAFDAGTTHLELLVSSTDTNMPAFYRIKTSQFMVVFSFKTFSKSEPPASDFSVPKPCTSVTT